MDNWKRMFRALWARRQKKTARNSSEDYVRLGLIRLEDRVVLDAAGVVVDLKPGGGSSSPASLTNFNGGVYFSASGTNASGQNVGRELYRLDTQGHVSLVADINPGGNDSNPTNFLVAGNTLFFSAIGATGRELYQVNSNNVVTLVADINPGAASSNPIPGIDYQGKLYFSALGASGNELYAYNRSNGSVSLVADLNPGSGNSTPAGFAAFGGNAYFYTSVTNSALYRIDPTGTVSLVASTPFEPLQLTPFGDTLYYTGLVTSSNRQLYALTLSPSNVETITQVSLPNAASNGTAPTDLTVIGDYLYFSALMQGRGRELYRIDSSGNIANLDLAAGSGGSSPTNFTLFNGDVYFRATVGGQRSLYRLDSTNASLTATLVPLPTGVTLQATSTLTALPEGLYFDASSTTSGRELYRLNPDGSIELTADINPGAADADPASVTSLGSETYLAATNSTVGRELFHLARSPSAIDIVGGKLVFQDLAGDRDNRLVISSDGFNLHVVDLNGPAIATTIAGVAGSNSNDVTIPLASLVGVTALDIQTRGGNDSVTFDLTTNALALLGQFSGWSLDGGADAGPRGGDRLRFLGDGVQTLRFTPDASSSTQGQVILAEANLTSNIQFVGIEGIDVGGMSNAQFVVPTSANPTDSLTIADGLDQRDGTQAALVVTGTVGGTTIAPVAFFQNQTVVVDTSTVSGGTDLIRVTGASGNHGNVNLSVKTGAASSGMDEVRITGAVTLGGALTLDSGDLHLQAPVQLGSFADLTARRDITLTSLGQISSQGDVALRADSDAMNGGGISIGVTSGIDAGAGQITLSATDDITIGGLVTQNATSGAVFIHSAEGQVLSNASAGPDISAESVGAVTTILANQSVGRATHALDLSVRNLVVVTQDANQFLSERNDLDSIDLSAGRGAIQLTAVGSIQDADGAVDVVAHDLLLKAQAAGSALAPLQTQLSHLEASVQDGGLYLRNLGDLTLGGASPALVGVTGLQSTGGDLDVATVGQLTVQEPVTNAANGVVRLAATDDVQINDVISTLHGDVTVTGDSDLSGGGGLTIGATGGINAGDGRVTLTATDNMTLGGVFTNNATADAVRVTSFAGSVLSRAAAGPDITAEVAGAVTTILANQGVGHLNHALDLSVRNLVVATQDSNQFLSERNDLDSIDLNAGSGAIQLTAVGAIQDADGSVDVVAHDLLLKAQAAGSALAPLQTQISHLEASVQDGGLYLRNTGDLTLGGASPTLAGVTGLQSTGGDLDVATVGQLIVQEQVTNLANGAVRLAATGDIHVNDLIATVHGDVTVTGDSDLSGGGGLTIGSAGGVDAGDGRVVLTATDNVTLGGVQTNNATTDAVRVTSFAGAVLSRAAAGPDITAEAAGAVTTILANQGVGQLNHALDLSVRNLVVVTQDSNQFLSERNDLESIDLNAGSGAIQLTAVGSIQDADGSIDVVAHDLLLKAQAAGTALTPLQTQLSHLEASVQDGGLYLRNTGDLTLGGASPALTGVTGLQSTGGDLDVATVGQLTVQEPVTNAANGAVRLVATGDVTINDLISTVHGDVTVAGDSDLLSGGALTMGANGGVDAGDGRVTLTATDNVTIGGVRTNNATTDAVRVTSFTGSVLSRGTNGPDITAEANGAITTILAPHGVGTTTNALDLSVRNLVVVTQDSDQFLSERNDLDSIDLNAGSGAIQLTAVGSIQDADGSIDVVAHDLLLKAQAAGTALTPLQTQISHLEASVQDGGLYLRNTGDLTLGGASPLLAGVAGLQSTGGDLDVATVGQLTVQEAVTNLANGSVRLAATGDVTINDIISTVHGDVTVTGDGDLVSGGALTMGATGGVDAGDGRVTLTATDNVTIGGVRTNNATTDAVRVTSFNGSVLSRGTNGPDITAEANGAITTILAPNGVGTTTSALDLSVRNLVVVTQDSDQFLSERNDLESIDLNAGSGAIQLTAFGSIQDADGSVDVVAHDLLLKAQAAGSALTPLQTQISHLKASVQDGGLYLRNTGDLTLGGASPALAGVTGLQSTGGDLDVATVGQLTVQEPVTNAANGSVRLVATGDVTINDLISTVHGDVTVTGDSDLLSGGALTMGATGGVDAGDGHVTLTATDNVTIGGMRTNNATTDAVRVTSFNGSVLSRGTNGPDITAEANGAITTILAPHGVGTTTNALDLSVRNLVVDTQDSDQFLSERNDLESIDLNAGSGAIQLAAVGAIQDADGSVDVVAHELQLKAQGAGASTAPLQTQISHLESTVQSGGLFLDNTTDLVIGGSSHTMAGVQGLQANGGPIELHAAGLVDVAVTVLATQSGSVQLTADSDIEIRANISSQTGAIRLAAGHDIHAAVGTTVSSTLGDIFLISDRDDALGGTIIYLGNIVIGGGSVTFRLSDATGLLSGIVQGAGGLIKDGLGQLTMTASSRNTYTGSTDVLAGILRVDGVIGSGHAAGPLTIAGGATLTGTGDINAPVWAVDPNAQILAENGFRMGDGSAAGFRYAGTLIIHSFDVVTVRDSDQAELGIRTTIESQARLIANRGVEIGAREQLDGDGVIQGNVVGLADSRIIPGHDGPGTLTTAPGQLRLRENAILVMEIAGDQPGTQYSQLIVNGTVNLQGAILDTPGKFVPANGTRITLINNDGNDRVVGNFRDVFGNALLQGSKFGYNGYEARISYRTGPGRNDVVVTLFTLPFTFTSSTSGTSESHARDAAAAIFMAALHEQRRNAINANTLPYPPVMETVVTPQQEVVVEAQTKTLESRTTSRLRLFIRIVNEGTNVESPTEYPLDPSDLRDLLSVFKRYRFPDGKYRVYLQEPDRNPRRILEVNVVDGKIVPPNFREAEQRATPPAQPEPTTQSSLAPPVELPWHAQIHAQLSDETEVDARIADLRRRYLTMAAR